MDGDKLEELQRRRVPVHVLHLLLIGMSALLTGHPDAALAAGRYLSRLWSEQPELPEPLLDRGERRRVVPAVVVDPTAAKASVRHGPPDQATQLRIGHRLVRTERDQVVERGDADPSANERERPIVVAVSTPHREHDVGAVGAHVAAACIGPGAGNPEAKQQTVRLLNVLAGA